VDVSPDKTCDDTHYNPLDSQINAKRRASHRNVKSHRKNLFTFKFPKNEDVVEEEIPEINREETKETDSETQIFTKQQQTFYENVI